MQDLEQMSREKKVEVVYALLQQIQPYLSASNLTVLPAPHYTSPQA